MPRTVTAFVLSCGFVVTLAASVELVALRFSRVNAAPVPKQPPKPPELTAEQITGGWELEWGAWGRGVVAFNTDGSYVCTKTPESEDVWYGRWELGGGVLTITEWVHDRQRDTISGPVTHKVLFDPKTAPEFIGKANGSTDVKMWGRVK